MKWLGYYKLTDGARAFFEEFFAAASVLPLSNEVITQAVRLRQTRKMTLGDSLVAATALVCGHELATRNIADFSWIAGLRVLDPLSQP